ncbi:F5/8 type C domain-containing protein [Tumebacillus sp. BK434]|uniref:discoidin domain-containing protein n=1 Tax=Tumebacillus sp. BK434 TaxID=2512169 RepID=UPI00104D7A87|nr:discoidin domain-containing protein [Tumebacillus sp. BK434]TCP57785.1 F5/8 type C domain-containing protein [Tumebacillus sp. BK434]
MSKLTGVLREHGVNTLTGASVAPYFGTGADGDLVVDVNPVPIAPAQITTAYGGAVANLVDGDSATYFQTTNVPATNGVVFQIDFGQSVYIDVFNLKKLTTGSNVIGVETAKLQYSNNGTSWTVFGNNVVNNTSATVEKDYALTAQPVSARYWRLVHTYDVGRTYKIAEISAQMRYTYLPVQNQDETTLVMNYRSITINKDAVLAPDKRCRGILLYSQGDVTLDGVIDVSGKAAFVNPETTLQMILPLAVKKIMQFDPSGNKFIVIPKGGYGGAGGNGGGYAPTTGRGGAGGFGTWYGGGVGGGGGGGRGFEYVTYKWGYGGNGGEGSSGPGSASTRFVQGVGPVFLQGNNGGIGAGGSGGLVIGNTGVIANSGNGGSSLQGGGGGGGGGLGTYYNSTSAGDGGIGRNLGGGALILVARGSITISSTGVIDANATGSAGVGGVGVAYGDSNNDGGGGGGGGGAGGGTVTIIHKGTFSNLGTITVNGSAGGVGGVGAPNGQNGSAGGIGSIAVYNLNN